MPDKELTTEEIKAYLLARWEEQYCDWRWFKDIPAAYAFTVQREKEITELEEEIENISIHITYCVDIGENDHQPQYRRTLARLERELENLKRGMVEK